VGKRVVLRIALKDVILDQQYMRWECEANSVRGEIGLTAR
jgi:hypothetical protein